MIDLHCHILDAIDDGARDADDSVAMARQAEGDGIEAICATPHIRHDHDVRIEELAGRVRGLNERLQRELVAVRILQGGEVAETAVEGLSEEELARVALGDGNWILLEPAPGPLDESLLRRVGHLADRGHRTIVAHPERHLSADMFERMAALVAEGALIQATADFFLRENMAKGMLAMAERGLVHVLSRTPTPFTAAGRCGSLRLWSVCAKSRPSPRTSSGSPRPPRERSWPATRSRFPTRLRFRSFPPLSSL